jgi:protein-tyrosine-phosphatase
MKTISFACVHDAGRSQMAAAFFNRLADPARAHAAPRGRHPATACIRKQVAVTANRAGSRPKGRQIYSPAQCR